MRVSQVPRALPVGLHIAIEMFIIIDEMGNHPIAPGHVDINIIAMIIPRASLACNLSCLYGRKFRKESSFA